MIVRARQPKKGGRALRPLSAHLHANRYRPVEPGPHRPTVNLAGGSPGLEPGTGPKGNRPFPDFGAHCALSFGTMSKSLKLLNHSIKDRPEGGKIRLGPPKSAIDSLLQMRRVSIALYCDLRDSCGDIAEIALGQFDVRCAKILFKSMQLGSSRNRNDPRFLSKQPSLCPAGDQWRDLCLPPRWRATEQTVPQS